MFHILLHIVSVESVFYIPDKDKLLKVGTSHKDIFAYIKCQEITIAAKIIMRKICLFYFYIWRKLLIWRNVTFDTQLAFPYVRFIVFCFVTIPIDLQLFGMYSMKRNLSLWFHFFPQSFSIFRISNLIHAANLFLTEINVQTMILNIS